MALDNGFRCVLILTSDIDLLYDQTLGRVKGALQGVNVLGKNDWKDRSRFERQVKTTPFVVVCSKNGNKLSSLLDALRAAGIRGVPALIIDDEADQASLNTHTQKGGAQISKINKAISELRTFFNVNTYIQVTATPQALFLQSPDNRYRPSFTVLSEPGEGYVGGDEFFGDPQRKLLREVDLNEVQALGAPAAPDPNGSVPTGLRKALLSFLVGATAKRIENPNSQFAFLCHVSMNKRDHEHILRLIDKFKDETARRLSESTKARERLLKELNLAYDDLQTTEQSLPPFDTIVEKLAFFLPGANVKLINATTSEEVKLEHVFNIFVGGNKLGRGVTIDNLLVSYYGRNPKKPNADTVLQHARMYGYRRANIGVTRLYLPNRLADHFEIIHGMESALRDLTKRYPEGEFEVLFISSPLQATRRNVLDPNAVVAYISGQSINPAYPLRSKEISKNTRWIDDHLQAIGDNDRYQEINIENAIQILEHCEADPNSEYGIELWDMRTIRSALETIRERLGDKAYLVVRRHRTAQAERRERQGILTGGDERLAPTDAPTLFMFRQDRTPKGQAEVWWPQLRFPEGSRNYVLSFSIAPGGRKK